jgi:retinol-binding protein 3
MTAHPNFARRAAAAAVLMSLLLCLTGAPASAQSSGPPGALELSPLDPAARAATVDSLCAALDSTYVFPDAARRMGELLRARLAEGSYNALTAVPDFTQRLTADLQSVSHDLHLRVFPAPPEAPENRSDLNDAERERLRIAEAARRNFGFEKLERLAGNVGYLDLRQFADAGAAGATAVAAMNFLAHSDALIIDLRQNGGGSPSMIQLMCSYLFSEPTHLNDFFIRRDGSTMQFWTQANVAGPRLDGVPVFVLTSARTFSAAEEFTYNLKNLKRATIVGETTGGGAHPVSRVAFAGLNIGATIPFGRAINPITGTNWEGTGVEPDVKVASDRALTTAHLAALDSLAARAAGRDDGEDTAQQLAWARTRVRVLATPVVLETKALRAYAGSYGPRRITLENGVLMYQRENGPRRRLIAAGDDLFLLDGVDTFQAKFTRDARGRVTKIVGLYDTGGRDENLRD